MTPRAVMLACIAMLAAATLLVAPSRAQVSADDAKVGIVDCTTEQLANHNPGLADKPDRLIYFEGFVSNFNVTPRDDKGKRKYLGVPHWVAHHIKRLSPPPTSGERPSKWFTMPELAAQSMAPTHESYQFSTSFKKAHKYWYDRGHLAQKFLVERLGQDAALHTHNVVNAVPQRALFN